MLGTRTFAQIGLAEDGQVAIAIKAMAAMRVPGVNDVIPRRHIFYGGSNGLDNSRRFMTKNDWQRILKLALDDFEIGMAKARGLDADQRIRCFQRGEPHLLDAQRLTIAEKDRRLEGLFHLKRRSTLPDGRILRSIAFFVLHLGENPHRYDRNSSEGERGVAWPNLAHAALEEIAGDSSNSDQDRKEHLDTAWHGLASLSEVKP